MNPTHAAAILFGGTGLVVAWFAVPPAQTSGSHAEPTTSERPRTESSVTADLKVETSRLRSRVETQTALGPPPRNPFRFEEPRPPRVVRPSSPAVELPPAPVRPPVPTLSLVGIAENATPDGPARTAVVSGMGQLFLLKEGEQFGGMFRVLRIGAESVEILNTRDNLPVRIALK